MLTFEQAQERVAGLVAQQAGIQVDIDAWQDVDDLDGLARLQGRLLATGDLITKAREQEREAALASLASNLAALDAQHAAIIAEQESAWHALANARAEAAALIAAAAKRYDAASARRSELLDRVRALNTERDRLTT